MNFDTFRLTVAKQFASMQKHALFVVDMGEDPRNALWNSYLASFPADSDPMYRERTSHDCSCCRSFIRTIGNVVSIDGGKVQTIWDVKLKDEPEYQAVADSLARKVRSRMKIVDVFKHYEARVGTEKNFEQLTDVKDTQGKAAVLQWTHFSANLERLHVLRKDDIAAHKGLVRGTHDVFKRALQEISLDTIDMVLDLMSQKPPLYRGEEHKFAVTEFRKLVVAFDKLNSDLDQDMFVWSKVVSALPGSVTNIRNTAIGTLLVDLESGTDIEDAVGAYEFKVSAGNYKRTTALITPKMIEQAKTKLADLGLTSALERRYATVSDITVNNILFANRDAKRKMSADVFDDLAAETGNKVNTKSLDKVQSISIEEFMKEVLPRVSSVEVLLENKHANNLVSLVAPIDPTAGNMFKWDNRFSWSYAGEFADSIKERVKKAGGNVTGDLCCRLAWDYKDDLDFYMYEPDGRRIYFSNRRSLSACGGMLDVDANGVDGPVDNPCENIFYADRNKMKEGVYKLEVHNYSRRSDGVGFEVEVEFDGQTHSFAYDKVVRDDQRITIAEIKYTKKDGFRINPRLSSQQKSKTVWGLPTQSFHKVNVLMLSPNHWDAKAVGNKHYFFMLDGCKNDSTARGFYNEFLSEELNAHRKVFEVLGGKLKLDDCPDQLSGLGFSSTQENNVTVRVTGSFTRTLRVEF